MWPTRDERGTGVVGTAFGAAVFIAFLLLATHTLLTLYAGSIVSDHAWTAARDLARSDRSQTPDDLVASTRSSMHGFKNVVVDIDTNPTDVTVHIGADRPNFLPAALTHQSHLGRIDKTVHVRVEEWR